MVKLVRISEAMLQERVLYSLDRAQVLEHKKSLHALYIPASCQLAGILHLSHRVSKVTEVETEAGDTLTLSYTGSLGLTHPTMQTGS